MALIPVRAAVAKPAERRMAKATEAAIIEKHNAAEIRAAGVMAEAFVSQEKMRCLDHLADHAMGGHHRLLQMAAARAQSDINAYEEFRLFVDMAKMAKAQVLADLTDKYCREGTR